MDSKAIASWVKKAKDAGIPVVAYDRLAEGPIEAYTSFDNDRGRQASRARRCSKALGDKAKPGAKIVMMNGSVTDPNAKLFKDGAHSVLDGKVNIGKEYDTKEWKPENANAEDGRRHLLARQGQDRRRLLRQRRHGRRHHHRPQGARASRTLPPVTGQDAELAAVQRIVTGEQNMSVYKPYPPEAETAAEMAVAVAKGEKLDAIATGHGRQRRPTKGVPSVLVPVAP